MTTNAQMSAAQRQYDNQQPPEDPGDFLESDTAQSWLDDAVGELLDGKTHSFTVTKGFRHERISLRYTDLHEVMMDTEQGRELAFRAAQLALNIPMRPENAWDIAQSDYKRRAGEIARDMLTNFAAEREEYERQQDELARSGVDLDGPFSI